MLLPREQSPWNCGYFLGAIALEVMKERQKKTDLQQMQRDMSQALRRPISTTQVVSAAAWLYLLDAVKLEEDGSLTLCD
jgi:uncharacterized membrane protein (DUF106 family)